MFQSTHPHGVRRAVYVTPIIIIKFQSTHPHGVRLDSREQVDKQDNVSIHAPTWGATVYGLRAVEQALVSIHAPTWGATFDKVTVAALAEFQSTHPHGVRLCLLRVVPHPVSFNPRTHMGCDVVHRSKILVSRVSIHAPTWGATGKNHYKLFDKQVSIHAPTWGATQNQWNIDQWNRVSIHAPTWGATLRKVIYITSLLFQSTHPHGVRRYRELLPL